MIATVQSEEGNVNPMYDIGMVGLGQLGGMLAQAAHKDGRSVLALGPETNSPTAQVGAAQLIGQLNDEARLLELAGQCRVLTCELEHWGSHLLEPHIGQYTIRPHPATVSRIRDKLVQHELLYQAGIPTAAFMPIENESEAQKAAVILGLPLMFKQRQNGFDGRGCKRVETLADIPAALQSMGGGEIYAEAIVPFVKELAVTVAQTITGSLHFFPVTETVQQDGQCLLAISSVDLIDKETERNAIQLAKQVMRARQGQQLLFWGPGVFTIEMYLLANGTLLVNEIAPRVHNSAHHTMDSCDFSQFDAHIQCILGKRVETPERKWKHAVMINILGQGEAPFDPIELERVRQTGTSAYWYGKTPRENRKLGHINCVSNDSSVTRMIDWASEVRASISV